MTAIFQVSRVRFGKHPAGKRRYLGHHSYIDSSQFPLSFSCSFFYGFLVYPGGELRAVVDHGVAATCMCSTGAHKKIQMLDSGKGSPHRDKDGRETLRLQGKTKARGTPNLRGGSYGGSSK